MAALGIGAVATALLMMEVLVATQNHLQVSATPVSNTVVRRSSSSSGPVGKLCWEGSVVHDPREDNTVWICKGGKWTAFNITRSTGTTEAAAAYSCKEIKESLCQDQTLVRDGTYWINRVDECGKKEGTVKVWCDMNSCGGGWTLVWKHSYLEVGPLTQNMYYFSKYYKECGDLNTGWCNIPYKSHLKPKEMMIAAYHNQKLVYAYKGDFNEMIDTDWTGGRLVNFEQCEDHCTSGNNGRRPAPSSHDDDPKLLGINFDKTTPDDEWHNCDTMHGTFASPTECRWHDCLLPSYISSKSRQTQMTMAIYVR